MSVLDKMEQLIQQQGNQASTLETMKLFFVGDLPANRVLNVPKPVRQPHIFDQFAHREIFKKMRIRNSPSFKPTQTLDNASVEGHTPSRNIMFSTELNSQSQCPSPCSSYLLKEKVKSAKAKLPNILYSRSVAEVLEQVSRGPRKSHTPNPQEMKDLQIVPTPQKKDGAAGAAKMVKLVDLVLPVIHQVNDLDQGEEADNKVDPSLSTECQSPIKIYTSRSSSTPHRNHQNKSKNQERVKNIIQDIVRKTQRAVIIKPQPAKISVPKMSLPLPFPDVEIGERQPPKKGYIVHDQICYKYWQTNYTNLKKQRDQVSAKLPGVSAQQYCILNTENLEFVLTKFTGTQIQVASLSKVVTGLLTILVCKKYNVDIQSYKCRVSDEAAEMPGTSAELETGDVLTVENLLYGLLLPSGNDAAVVLAENMGRIIQKNRKKPSLVPPAKTFIKQMNVLYKELLEDSTEEHVFQNPSGLSNNPNKTTAEQITLISAVALQNPTFKQVVCTKEYQISFRNERYDLNRKLMWRNTNKLLWKNWEGVKTGTTETAGHCFIGKYNKYLISVFDCATMNKRFTDAAKLLEWLGTEQM